MSRQTLKLLLALLGVILVIVWIYSYKWYEGFEVPRSSSTTSLPSDVAGSTSSNPMHAKAQATDVQSLQELIRNYQLIREKINLDDTNLSEQQKTKITFVELMEPTVYKELESALQDPDTSKIWQSDIIHISQIYNDMIHDLRNATIIRIQPLNNPDLPVPTTVANNPGVISLLELTNLKKRIEEEITRLVNLRSSSPTLQARINQLIKLSADIGEMISAIDRNVLKLEDVPIKPDNAEAFMSALTQDNALPTLVSPAGTMEDSLKASPDSSAAALSSLGMPANVQSLLEQAKYLKWNVSLNLEYDPKIAAQDRLMGRLEEMEKRLTNLVISETPIPPQVYQMYLQELHTLQMSLAPKGNMGVHSGTPLESLHSTYTRDGVDQGNPYVRNNEVQLSQPENPSYTQINAAQGYRQGPNGKFPNGEISPDVYVRPGFVMTDDAIARRASASAFDPAAVGGLDYKKRAQEICRQIRSGQIGEPDNFGCIANPDAVSSNYSWKGNYEMVCNRLGDTWGGWYPEMFGCPKYDPTAKFKGSML